MCDFTYEEEDRIAGLETYEWDNVWWEQADDQVKARALYIGDSISCGIRRVATRLSGEKILFDGFGTSKAVDNEYFIDSVRLFGKQQRMREVVIFNNGLHGFHLSDAEEYKAYYENIVSFLMEEYKNTPLILALTTSVAGSRNERVIVRNAAVREIAEKYKIPIVDLYAVSVEYVGLRCNDGAHFSAEGYEKLAEKLLEAIYKIVPELAD